MMLVLFSLSSALSGAAAFNAVPSETAAFLQMPSPFIALRPRPAAGNLHMMIETADELNKRLAAMKRGSPARPSYSAPSSGSSYSPPPSSARTSSGYPVTPGVETADDLKMRLAALKKNQPSRPNSYSGYSAPSSYSAPASSSAPSYSAPSTAASSGRTSSGYPVTPGIETADDLKMRLAALKKGQTSRPSYSAPSSSSSYSATSSPARTSSGYPATPGIERKEDLDERMKAIRMRQRVNQVVSGSPATEPTNLFRTAPGGSAPRPSSGYPAQPGIEHADDLAKRLAALKRKIG
ncbi:unnamed protein product [Vitrella brassicaformis CCMP3155]|uniref:WH2 domain-containing protein n=2 Tax=Vitrella brassicaformis TaxID=1169539 RepID=A0A0G4EEG1_VITBC|nr:unnamed protein product [Vitrella brassicaformis CCMP3155]|eukprot:CEL93773.1 unnamed protein product [Vitrella brassicaformis CCMP3155]